MEDEDLEGLHEELAAVAFDAARELISGRPDTERVDQLDARAALLRARIKELAPARPDEYEPSPLKRASQ